MIAKAVSGLTALSVAVSVPARADPLDSFEIAQLSVRSRVVVRIQTEVVTVEPMAWREKKGPRCLPAALIQGAAVVAPASVDFILRGGQRVRARFAASCPALAYYSGFYVTPNADGQMCAGRDSVRDRAGGECEVAKLRSLVAKP